MSWYNYEGDVNQYLRAERDFNGTTVPRTQVELRSKQNAAKAAEIDAWVAREQDKLAHELAGMEHNENMRQEDL